MNTLANYFCINKIADNALTAPELSIQQLKKENDFLKYLKLLRNFSHRYTVIIVSYDTPYGPGYKHDLSAHIMSLGLGIDLFGKFRAAYGAVIDSGKVVFERISEGTAIEFIQKIGSCDVKFVSTGYDSNDWISCLKINNIEYFAKSRGLNFVVFDKITGYILDSVGFDTYSEGYPCTRPSETSDFIKRIAKERSVKIICCKFPKFPDSNLSQNEKMLIEKKETRSALYDYYDSNGVNGVTTIPKSYYDVNGVRRFCDYSSKFLNTNGGHRMTAYQPESHKHTIFMVGGCRMYGLGSDDSRTIESYLQQIFNVKCPEKQYIVQNYGFMFEGLKKDEMPSIIENLPLKPGDIIITEFSAEKSEDITFIDITDAFSVQRDFEVFYDTIHYTPDGNRITAEGLFNGLVNNGLLNDNNDIDFYGANNKYGFDSNQSKELKEYKRILSDYYSEMFPEPVIGSIVMNCNPFTLGHRFLIDKALEQCDFLIIFLVQEDKSVFPFDDRLKLIDECTSDIPNKEIIPSGRFIISSLTFSEYFNKSELQERSIDTSLDVTVFAREIAPCLHITKRFAGEEPNDKVTRQYNETMGRVLPEYGIEFVEIPRAIINDEVISASRVRSLLTKKDFNKIKELVPEPTYNYLLKNFDT